MTPEGAKPARPDPEAASSDQLSSGDEPADAADDAPVGLPPRASPKRTPKQRLDQLLVERGLVQSREQARRLVLAGDVRVHGAVVDKAGTQVPNDAQLEVREPPPYVSRGGLKLAAALDAFALDVRNLVAIDVGASTGGFTDCLLQRGVSQVFAIDVGYGQLAWKVRSDPRVVVLDRTNIRYLEHLPDGMRGDLAVIDASFISLSLVLPPTLNLLTPEARIIALVKPQFEAGRGQVGKGGVVRDARIHREVLQRTTALATQMGLHVGGVTVSPAPGPAGNLEFLLLLLRTPPHQDVDVEAAIVDALEQASTLLRRGAVRPGSP